MATRFYLSGDAFSVVNPGVIGSWNGTSLMQRMKLVATTPPDDLAMSTVTVTMSSAMTSLHRQYISEPMAAGISFTSGTTWTLVMRFDESSTSANAYARMHVAIISEDGTTVRAQFSAGEKDDTEISTSFTSRKNVNTGGIVYTTVAGDRLVLEHGCDKDGTGSYSVSYRYGNMATSDLLSGDGEVDDDNPWFECSTNITFDAGGEDPPPASDPDWNCTTFISAVLDEWV